MSSANTKYLIETVAGLFGKTYKNKDDVELDCDIDITSELVTRIVRAQGLAIKTAILNKEVIRVLKFGKFVPYKDVDAMNEEVRRGIEYRNRFKKKKINHIIKGKFRILDNG